MRQQAYLEGVSLTIVDATSVYCQKSFAGRNKVSYLVNTSLPTFGVIGLVRKDARERKGKEERPRVGGLP